LELFSSNGSSSQRNLLENIDRKVLETLQSASIAPMQSPSSAETATIYPIYYHLRPHLIIAEDSLIKAIDNWNEYSVDNYLQQKIQPSTKSDQGNNDNGLFKVPSLPTHSSSFMKLEPSSNTVDNLLMNSNTMNGLLDDLLDHNNSNLPKDDEKKVIKTETATSQSIAQKKENNNNIKNNKNNGKEEEIPVSTTNVETEGSGFTNLLSSFTSFPSNLFPPPPIQVPSRSTSEKQPQEEQSQQPFLSSSHSLYIRDMYSLPSPASQPSGKQQPQQQPAPPTLPPPSSAAALPQEWSHDGFSQQSQHSNLSVRNFAHIFDPSQTNILSLGAGGAGNSMSSCPPLPLPVPLSLASKNNNNSEKNKKNEKTGSKPSTPSSSSSSSTAVVASSLYQSIIAQTALGTTTTTNTTEKMREQSLVPPPPPPPALLPAPKSGGGGGFTGFSPQTVVTPISDTENEASNQLLLLAAERTKNISMNIFPATSSSQQQFQNNHNNNNNNNNDYLSSSLTTPMKNNNNNNNRKRKFNGLELKREELLKDSSSNPLLLLSSPGQVNNPLVDSHPSNHSNHSNHSHIHSSSGYYSSSNTATPSKLPRKPLPPSLQEQQLLTEKIFSGLCHVTPGSSSSLLFFSSGNHGSGGGGSNNNKSGVSSMIHKLSRQGRTRPELRRITPTFIGSLPADHPSRMMTKATTTTAPVVVLSPPTGVVQKKVTPNNGTEEKKENKTTEPCPQKKNSKKLKKRKLIVDVGEESLRKRTKIITTAKE
jgi:hypothetical protein